jgi:two-component system NtrC family sensor kinase
MQKTPCPNFLAQVINAMADPVFVKDRQHRIILANDAFCSFHQRRRDDLIGKTSLDLFPVAEAEAMWTNAEKVFATKGEVISEEQVTDAQGRAHTIVTKKTLCRDENGHEILVGVFRDITEQKRMEQRLSEALTYQQTLIEAAPVGIICCKASGEIVSVNHAAAKIAGGTVQAMMKMSVRDIESVKVSGILAAMEEVLATGREARREFYVTTSFGRSACLNGRIVAFDHGKERYLLLLGIDITDQKKAEMALQQSEHRYRVLFNHCHNAVFLNGPPDASGVPGQFIEVNDVACEKLGYTRQELLQLSPRDIIAPETIAGLPPIGDMLEEFGQARWEGIDVAKDGRRIPVEIHTHMIELNGQPTVLSEVRDLTEQRASEEQLRKLSLAVEQSPVSIVITDPQGNIEYVNPKFVSVTGYAMAEVLGKNPRVLKSGLDQAELHEKLWATISAGREWHGEFCNKKKNGELFWESVSISPIKAPDGAITHFLAVKEDISAHKKLENEFRQAQKMEAFGRLAAGVAHDFNNMMTSVLCSAEILELDGPLAPTQKEAVTEIVAAANRATALTRQLLMFSRRQAVQLKVFELNDVVENMGKMLRRLIGEDISLKTHYGPGGSPVLADPGMLEQVLMNLAVNSRDAMPNGGDLLIQTANIEITKPTSRQQAGRFVRLSVSDSGCGIAPGNLEHIFEPFFTTKEVGKGTGLGLATVFGIVEQHKGWIEVESQVERGTTFHIYLPRQNQVAAESAVTPFAARQRGGKETILVVEDDQSLRAIARRILSQFGYRIFEAGSGPEALGIWQQRQSEIDLLFTDVVMPGKMSGVELARRLAQDKPGLKVVYASGYTDEMLNENSALRQTRNFIEKPYSPAILLRQIRTALD